MRRSFLFHKARPHAGRHRCCVDVARSDCVSPRYRFISNAHAVLPPLCRLLLLLFLLTISTDTTRAQEGEWILLDSLENMQYWSLDCFDPMNCAVTGDSTGWSWFVRITDDGWKTSRIII